MNKSVAHYISELLFLHDCVIIPGFGGFVGNKKSAQLNKTTGSLSPPSKQILFNTNLKANDGLLISHVAKQEEVTHKIAEHNVEIFANEIRHKLTNSKVLRIDKIGLFTLAKEGNIIYIQDSSKNYSLDAFGMKPTYNKLVSRKAEATKKIERTVLKIRNTRKKPKALLHAAAVIIPLIALSYLSISHQEKINNVYVQMATLNPFAANKIVEYSSITESEVKLDINPIAEDVISEAIISQKTYYIIAGAFAEQKNAIQMLSKLNKWNYNAEILEESNLLRVSYDSFSNREDAVFVLNKIKQENPNAWLLTK